MHVIRVTPKGQKEILARQDEEKYNEGCKYVFRRVAQLSKPCHHRERRCAPYSTCLQIYETRLYDHGKIMSMNIAVVVNLGRFSIRT